MRLSIKTKQVLGVTSTVGAVVVALSLYHLGKLAEFSLEESEARGLLLSRAIYQRAQGVAPRASDAYAALREDAGLKSILESSIYSRDVTDAAIVDPRRQNRGALRSEPHRPHAAATRAGGGSARAQPAPAGLGDLHRPGAGRRSA